MTINTPRDNPFGDDAEFLIAGLVRDCAKHLRGDVLRLKSAMRKAKKLNWLLIESDSTDDSRVILEDLSEQVPYFRFLSLGVLSTKMPFRTERLAYCRNAYLRELTNPVYGNVRYVIISDFDGINTEITEHGIASCWSRKDWDVCSANQNGPYYDIWALRHNEWCPNDCLAQYRFLNKYSSDRQKNLYAAIHSKMITIPIDSDWIEVESAFGGLAIYRRKAIEMSKYEGLTRMREEISEHVTFHKGLKAKGFRIFINPQMVNARYTEHTEHLISEKRMRINFRDLWERKVTRFIR